MFRLKEQQTERLKEVKRLDVPKVNIAVNDELAEVVYMTSGDLPGIHATAQVRINQRPSVGDWNFRGEAIVSNAEVVQPGNYYVHLIARFSHPVNVLDQGSGFTIISDGPNSYTIELCMQRWVNGPGDQVQFGALRVMTENNEMVDLQVISAYGSSLRKSNEAVSCKRDAAFWRTSER